MVKSYKELLEDLKNKDTHAMSAYRLAVHEYEMLKLEYVIAQDTPEFLNLPMGEMLRAGKSYEDAISGAWNKVQELSV